MSEHASLAGAPTAGEGGSSEPGHSGHGAHRTIRAEKAVPDDLSEAERAVWRDPELLARIEAVLDDPSHAVLLDETALNPNTARDRTDLPSGRQEP